MLHERSREILMRGCRFVPGITQFPVSVPEGPDEVSLVAKNGEGAFLFDVDGNQYLDFVQSRGSLILGHRHPVVVDALEEAFKKGLSFGTPIEADFELAQLLVDSIPSIEKVALLNSRTEATIHAIHLSRVYTGRSRIVHFEGNYHGHVDSLLQVTPGSLEQCSERTDRGESSGFSESVKSEMIRLPYNDVEALRKVFQERGSEIAAVLVEPIAGNMGCIAGSSNFLYELRHQTRNAGSVLVFDEVRSGFRVDFGGAQRRFSITPDLTLLGNVLGGGLPIGAIGGKAEIMDHFSPTEPVLQSEMRLQSGIGLQSEIMRANPLAIAVGLATIRHLRDENPYHKLERKTAILAEGLEDEARTAGFPVFVEAWGSMLTVFFLGEEPNETAEKVQEEVATTISVGGNKVQPSIRTSSSGTCFTNKIVDWKTASSCNLKRYANFAAKMLERGYYIPMSPFEPVFISTEMTEKDVYEMVKVIGEVFRTLD
ncbi:MAG: aspartate aminotransferase family protein [Thermoguttaceae bacterium]